MSEPLSVAYMRAEGLYDQVLHAECMPIRMMLQGSSGIVVTLTRVSDDVHELIINAEESVEPMRRASLQVQVDAIRAALAHLGERVQVIADWHKGQVQTNTAMDQQLSELETKVYGWIDDE